jgi:hypothetical protein
MKQKQNRDELFKIETTIKENGKDEYLKYVNNNKNDYWNYIISRRIYSFRCGLFPTTKNIVVSPIGENWAKFLNAATITNQDYIDIIEMFSTLKSRKYFPTFLLLSIVVSNPNFFILFPKTLYLVNLYPTMTGLKKNPDYTLRQRLDFFFPMHFTK